MVDANSGSLDTQIDLPSYNPNVAPIALVYDSVTANPEPIITVENTIPATVPSQVSAQLTFNGGTPLTKYYYDTSTSTSILNTGDVQQINLQATECARRSAPAGTATQREVVDVGSGVATLTYSGGTNLLNYSSNDFGAGWTLQGLEQITSATGGVVLDLGDNGRSLWFASGGSGGGYSDPAGEFSTLVSNSGRRMDSHPDRMARRSSSIPVVSRPPIIDLNKQSHHASRTAGESYVDRGLQGQLHDIHVQRGLLCRASKTRPTRFATFTHSGGNLTQVELPDASTWNYSYASGGQLTQITDPLSHTVTINYDSGGG